MASSHIMRRPSLGSSLEERAFSGSDTEPLGKIKGCKAVALCVKLDGLPVPACGIAHKQGGIRGSGNQALLTPFHIHSHVCV